MYDPSFHAVNQVRKVINQLLAELPALLHISFDDFDAIMVKGMPRNDRSNTVVAKML